MEKKSKRPSGGTELPEEEVRRKIADMLEKVKDVASLERIYRFIQYIYIHRM